MCVKQCVYVCEARRQTESAIMRVICRERKNKLYALIERTRGENERERKRDRERGKERK